MYEFHGWIKLAESPQEIDCGDLEEKCGRLKEALAHLKWSSGKAELLTLNGFHVLTLNGIPGRRRSEAHDLDRILTLVAQDFKGAYGVVYEYDVQTQTAGGRGVFSVKVIKRRKD